MPLDKTDQEWLAQFISREGGIAGTVHRVCGGDLYLTAALNIPPSVLDAVSVVPRGKGMAGLALVHAQPMQTCDLKDDDSGNVRPLARTVEGHAAIALPVMLDGVVGAVVGISFSFAGDIPPDTANTLAGSAATLLSAPNR